MAASLEAVEPADDTAADFVDGCRWLDFGVRLTSAGLIDSVDAVGAGDAFSAASCSKASLSSLKACFSAYPQDQLSVATFDTKPYL